MCSELKGLLLYLMFKESLIMKYTIYQLTITINQTALYTGVNYVADTVQCFFQLFITGIKSHS